MLFRSHALNPTDYTPVGDLTVVALCLIIAVLLAQTYIRKDKNFKLMLGMLTALVIGSISNVLFQMLVHSEETLKYRLVIYASRFIHNIAIIGFIHLYGVYLHDPLWISERFSKIYRRIECGIIIPVILFDACATAFGFGFRINSEGSPQTGVNLFIPLYGIFMASILYMVIRYRYRLIKQVYRGLLGVNIISWFIMASQGPHKQQSFTMASIFFLLMGIFFIFHSNPYDVDTGAVSSNYFFNELNDAFDKERRLVIMSCTMLGFDKNIKESKDLKLEFYDFFRKNVRRGVLYRFPNERFVLTLPLSEQKDTKFIIEKMLSDFGRKQKKFGLEYKIVICETVSDITDSAEYAKLIDFVEASMAYNNIHRVDENDIQRFFDSRYILDQLDDIMNSHDLNDGRVLLYLQPVFNITTGTYDTAEALMRLRLEKTGLVFPDKFIPLAEQNGQIHALSMIILNKTCRIIKHFTDNGLDIKRISVNFSAIDLKYDSFCKEVREIITMNGIPFEKIAVEITESRSEQDFKLMKSRIMELQNLGIKFYLDDFGTGYSNFERIMELPFDIIKFDRSLLIEMGKNYSSEYMVSTFAGMFIKLGYSVLFEGVENEKDEKNCVRMNAGYLQGYKYSKPIPAADIKGFLQPIAR